MAVLGNQLQFFTELFRSVEYFHFTPQPVAGFSKREILGTVRGVFQFMKKGELKSEGYTLADTEVPTFWTREKLSLGEYFIEFDNEIYRITNKADWSHEGGFTCYELELYVGNTDIQQPFDYVNIGIGEYD